MLFLTDKKFTTIINPEAIKLVPELKDFSAKEALFLIIALDYDSPYKLYPPEERMRKARLHVFGKEEFNYEDQRIKRGIEAYKSLQFDVKIETIDKYKAKIVSLHGQLMTETQPRNIESIDKTIERLIKRMEDIQNQVDTDQRLDLKGGGELSFIEKWQKNRKTYLDQQRDLQDRSGVVLLD